MYSERKIKLRYLTKFWKKTHSERSLVVQFLQNILFWCMTWRSTQLFSIVRKFSPTIFANMQINYSTFYETGTISRIILPVIFSNIQMLLLLFRLQSHHVIALLYSTSMKNPMKYASNVKMRFISYCVTWKIISSALIAWKSFMENDGV